jgi:acetyl esterase/lipase
MKNIVLLLLLSIVAKAQKIDLYSGPIPNAIAVSDSERTFLNDKGIQITEKVSKPTLQFFPAAGPSEKPCVLICPGGGYWILADKHEGTDVAQYFNSLGLHAAVLKYRIPFFSGALNPQMAPLQDVQRALIVLTENSSIWGINAQKIGIMGFSAGGHLAASASVHYRTNILKIPDAAILKPAFSILVYPVTTFEYFGHKGSGNALVGKNATQTELDFFATYKYIDSSTPPAFLVHAKDDLTVPFKNATVYQKALKKHHVSQELYLTPKGGHGFGLVNPTDKKSYTKALELWLKRLDLL